MNTPGVIPVIVLSVCMWGRPAEAGFVDQPEAARVDTPPRQTALTEVIPVGLALSLRDQTAVTLEGHILRQTGSDKYVLHDGTGSIEVRIADSCWPAHPVTPGDRVRLEGRVSRDWLSVDVEVRTVKRLSGPGEAGMR